MNMKRIHNFYSITILGHRSSCKEISWKQGKIKMALIILASILAPVLIWHYQVAELGKTLSQCALTERKYHENN